MTTQNPQFYNRVEAAEYLGVKPHTLDVWACTKRYDLKYIKVGRLVKYKKEHLDEFLAGRVVGSDVKTPLQKPENTPIPKEPNQDARDLAIVSEALIKIHRLIGEHAKLDACNSLLTPYNVEQAAKVMQACMRHLYAVSRGDEATAEIWAHKIKLMTTVR